MEKYTVSLEIAKQLEDNGWVKETEYHWMHNITGVEPDKVMHKFQTATWKIYRKIQNGGVIQYYSAPIAEEILEQLPFLIKDAYLEIDQNGNDEWVLYYEDNPLVEKCYSKKLSDALALLWIELKKNNLI